MFYCEQADLIDTIHLSCSKSNTIFCIGIFKAFTCLMLEGHGLDPKSPFYKSMFDQTWPLQLGPGCLNSVSFMIKLECATQG